MTRLTHALTAMAASAMLAVACPAAAQTGNNDAGRYDRFFIDAMLQRQKGNNDAAFDLLKHCVHIRPEAPEAYFFLAQYYMSLKQNDKAIECFKKAADLEPDNSTYLETLAKAYVTNDNDSLAIGTLEKIVEKETGRIDILEMLVQLYQNRADYDNTIKTLDRLETLEGKNERLTYAKSEIYSLTGDKKAAINEMKKLADQYPNDLNYRGMYGDALLMNGREKEAFDIYTGILKAEPDNYRAQLSMRAYYKQKDMAADADSMTMQLLLNKNTGDDARVYIMRQEIAESENGGGDSTKILRLFDRMMAQPQASTDIAILYATYMSLKKMPQEKIEAVLEKVLAQTPDNAAARLQLVAYAWQRDDLDRVIELCKAARQYNPDEMAFYYYEGMAHFRKDDNDSALNAFQNGISVIGEHSDPDIVSDFYAVMGDLLYEKGRAAEAYAAYDSCLQWKDDNIGCLNNYAYYLSVNGDSLDKAEKMSYRTVKAEPKNATYLDTYAWILFMQGRYAEAKIYIDQAVQNDSDSSAVILEHAGDIHAKAGDIDGAVELWARAAAKDPANKLLARKIRQRKYIKE
ncbi:tetratricopeptide repeat protein [Marseilla massiliensis]|uniref:tetratricopeptide repeat protein n=1 Tax=Marseilla massiliensis TaxID=1841864 RepID=UPI002011B936|nr:tetratricopeptide repeat protein [Marseilla massiliensis]MCL1611582.1 tetratricopeptide repeat protein [Marseilla massiliensis]